MFHGLECSCCSGPHAWQAFLASSSSDISSRRASLLSTATAGHSERGSIKPNTNTNVNVNWPHFPTWLLPTTRGEMRIRETLSNSDLEAQSTISIDSILNGHTRSPISLKDFRSYLKSFPHLAGEQVAVEFLIEFEEYKARFLALPSSQQAPHPYTVVEHLSSKRSSNKKAPKEPSQPTGGSDRNSLPALPPEAILHPHRRTISAAPETPIRFASFNTRPRSSTYSPGGVFEMRKPSSRPPKSPKLDAATQALRPELEAIIDRYFIRARSQPLVELIPPEIFSLALSEAHLTTHPSTLERIATTLNQHLSLKVLPAFLDSAVINLSNTTSTGRLIMAAIALALGIFLTAVMVIYGRGRLHRAARLCLTPLFLIGLGYAIGSQTGLCFWLAWRGTREEKGYEEQDKPRQAELPFHSKSYSTASSASSWSWDSLKKKKRRSSPLLQITSPRRFRNAHAYPPGFRTSIYTINERGSYTLPSPRNLTFIAKVLGPRGRYSTLHDPARAGRRRSNGWSWEHAKRMMGTATSTVKVEDERVKQVQNRIALKVSVWLVLGTTAAMAVVLSIP